MTFDVALYALIALLCMALTAEIKLESTSGPVKLRAASTLPLMALSLIWPVGFPIVLVALWFVTRNMEQNEIPK